MFKPTWIYWKALQFLLPVLNPRSSRDTLPTCDDKVTDVTPGPSNVLEEESSGMSSTSAPSAKKRKSSGKHNAATNTKDELMVECLKVMRSTPEPAQPDPSVESTFAAYITEKLKTLDCRRRRMIAEGKISDVILQLQLEMGFLSLYRERKPVILKPS